MMADGISYIFGNPGTVEQGILDELYQFPEIRYITCLQESVAVAMADGISASGAVKALEHCAELTGASVYGVNTSCIHISQSSPYYQGDLGRMFGENSKKAVQDADVVLIVGTYAFPEVFPCLEMPFRVDANIFHVDLDVYEIAKNYPVIQGICANPRLALEKINSILKCASMPYRKNHESEPSSISQRRIAR